MSKDIERSEPVIEGNVISPDSDIKLNPDGTVTVDPHVIRTLLAEWDNEAAQREKTAQRSTPLGPAHMMNAAEASIFRACSARLISVLNGEGFDEFAARLRRVSGG